MPFTLVTGGCGFIGSNFIRQMRLEEPGRSILNFDLLTYAGNLENLVSLESDEGYQFVKGDIADGELVAKLFEDYEIDSVVHFAAESHVDRSISGPSVFVQTNVTGTQVLLEAARTAWSQGEGRFLMVSTDEVYGSLGETGLFREDTPLDPSSPYSASKAAADLLCIAYHRTFGFPVVLSRCSNNYGPYQFPEKLIPLMIQRASQGEKLPVYGDGLNVRDWIHVDDHNRALRIILEKGELGRVYNVGADNEQANLHIVESILYRLSRPRDLIEYVTDRPGHDRRYAMDSTRLQQELGWRPQVEFAEGLASTVDWYLDNREWWERILSGEYRDYYERQYGGK
ncbi:dTDP-glucose 4,6-dehydratase [bacterium]|nr:dTDP-glucose 4,6-dehydratase [bacterium]